MSLKITRKRQYMGRLICQVSQGVGQTSGKSNLCKNDLAEMNGQIFSQTMENSPTVSATDTSDSDEESLETKIVSSIPRAERNQSETEQEEESEAQQILDACKARFKRKVNNVFKRAYCDNENEIRKEGQEKVEGIRRQLLKLLEADLQRHFGTSENIEQHQNCLQYYTDGYWDSVVLERAQMKRLEVMHEILPEAIKAVRECLPRQTTSWIGETFNSAIISNMTKLYNEVKYPAFRQHIQRVDQQLWEVFGRIVDETFKDEFANQLGKIYGYVHNFNASVNFNGTNYNPDLDRVMEREFKKTMENSALSWEDSFIFLAIEMACKKLMTEFVQMNEEIVGREKRVVVELYRAEIKKSPQAQHQTLRQQCLEVFLRNLGVCEMTNHPVIRGHIQSLMQLLDEEYECHKAMLAKQQIKLRLDKYKTVVLYSSQYCHNMDTVLQENPHGLAEQELESKQESVRQSLQTSLGIGEQDMRILEPGYLSVFQTTVDNYWKILKEDNLRNWRRHQRKLQDESKQAELRDFKFNSVVERFARVRKNFPLQYFVDSDLVIVIDSSGSIGKDNYDVALTFAARLASTWALRAASRVSVLIYSSIAQVIVPLDNRLSAQEIGDTVRTAAYLSSGTASNLGLDLSLQQFQANSRNVPKQVVFLTDGDTDTDKKELLQMSIDNLRNLGIEIISVGIGSAINKNELFQIAQGVQKNVLMVGDFDQLLGLLEEKTLEDATNQGEIGTVLASAV